MDKKVEEALNSMQVEPTSIDGILITHEHSDHVKGLGTFSKKFDVPIYANQETLDNMEAQTSKIAEKNINHFKVKDKFCLGDLEIKPFSISHDAANPCGFNIFKDNKKISIATDIGQMDTKTIKNLEEDYEYQVEIEYEYSEQMIKGVLENLESIDNIISNSLVKYTIDRLSYVDRAIIRLATYEMKFLNLAKEVAIDEALLITREYSSLENDAQVKFNNKLLDNISKAIYE